MGLFWKKERKEAATESLRQSASVTSSREASLADLDEPPRPLFDQHRSQLGNPRFEQKMQETLELPKTLATPQDAMTHFPLPSSSSSVSPFSSTVQEHHDEVPYNFDVLLEEAIKHDVIQQETPLEQKNIENIEQPISKKIMGLKVVPLEAVFLPLLNLTNAEEVIYALQEDLALSDDTLYRVDELNKAQLFALEKWHLELDMVDTLLNHVDCLLFSQQAAH